MRRVPAGLEQIILLIRVGVFRSFGLTKKELLWHAHALVNSFRQHEAVPDLFEVSATRWCLPPLWQHELEDAYDELELLGFPLQSPFALAAEPLHGLTVRELPAAEGQLVTLVGYLITYKRITAKNGKPMVFGYFLDREGDYLDTTHFPGVVMAYPLKGPGLYRLDGRVVVEYGCPMLEVRRLEKLALRPDPRGGSGD